ncbi:hypothetical protein Rhopal_002980-T1 [Rhodotorula paludigena]|uniref:Uncharacterized protein n=1 Tax=Rhodotorula paludigena TaxID=86838 RepID=A0AAV5GBZ8_9BASI|nr:hypothetical protein Rhopal_002980-T1 [Rhodotorula paludigena]
MPLCITKSVPQLLRLRSGTTHMAAYAGVVTALLYAGTLAIHLGGLGSGSGGTGASPAVLECEAAQQELAQTPLMHSILGYEIKDGDYKTLLILSSLLCNGQDTLADLFATSRMTTTSITVLTSLGEPFTVQVRVPPSGWGHYIVLLALAAASFNQTGRLRLRLCAKEHTPKDSTSYRRVFKRLAAPVPPTMFGVRKEVQGTLATRYGLLALIFDIHKLRLGFKLAKEDVCSHVVDLTLKASTILVPAFVLNL